MIEAFLFFSVSILLVATLIQYTISSSTPPSTKQIPGPKGKPLIGNLLDIPTHHSWLKFKEWADLYGPIFRLNIAGRTHLVLSTHAVANELLRERGNRHSSREQLPMLTKLVSGSLRPLLLPYDDRWRRVRKFIHKLCMDSAAESYQPTQELETKRFLYDFLQAPGQYEKWLERFAGGLILRLGYGHPLKTGEEGHIRLMVEHVHVLEKVASPGAYLVETFPTLAYLPDWLAPFKRYGKMLHLRELNFFRTLLGDVDKEIAKGTAAETSFARTYLDNKAASELTFDEAAYALGTLFEAGASTTAASMMSFILAMVLYPKWQDHMAAEIDSVVGERMPTFDDLPKLPMVRAVIKEVLRWRPVTAGGFPHKSTEDDMYDNYFIPAGTILHPNQWAIHHDPQVYTEPDTFNPERWLHPTLDVSLKDFPNFGYGRRICPGQHIVSRSLFILACNITWACTITQARDSNGDLIAVPEYNYTSGINSQPEFFRFAVQERRAKRWETVRKEWETAQREDPLKDMYGYELQSEDGVVVG